jgi:hypothetical protein
MDAFMRQLPMLPREFLVKYVLLVQALPQLVPGFDSQPVLEAVHEFTS